jgi:hypothetical protein
MKIVSSLINTLLSGLVGAFIALWLDTLNNPVLEVIASDNTNDEIVYPPQQVVPGRAKFFRVFVKNKDLPWFLPKRLFNRETAEQLNAEITFKELGKTMKGRWAGTLELPFANPQDKMRLANFPESENISPGKSEILDVFVKFENDLEAYGWNNEAYLFNWRTPYYQLEPRIHTVEVNIVGLNTKISGFFQIQIGKKIEDCYIKNIGNI